jgi:hypothetical protein
MQFKIIGLACIAVLCGCNNESKQPATSVAAPSIFESFVNKRVCAVIQFEHFDHSPALQYVCGVLLQVEPDGLLVADLKNTTIGIREGSSIVLPITVVQYVCTFGGQPSTTTTSRAAPSGEYDCFSH